METDRYLRQIPLVGSIGQEKLQKSHVVIVGLGALGTVASELLVRSGVGQLTLIDRDVVELSNLQRQGLYCEKDVGRSKVLAARDKLLRINSSTVINIHAVHLDSPSIMECISTGGADLILDCTDNMSTRFLINDFARKYRVPWIFSSAIISNGMLQLITPESSCLRCRFPDHAQGDTCSESGVFAMTTHTIASLQSNLALRFLIGADVSSFLNTLISFDLSSIDIRKFVAAPNKSCDTCNEKFLSLDSSQQKEVVRFCSSGQFQVCKRNSVNLKALSLTLEKEFDDVKLDELSLRFGKMIVFSDGRALIRCKTKEEAISLYDRYIGN